MLKGIQPTYEELKRIFSAPGFRSVGCIQPTYEELKQSFCLRECNACIRYPAYLWGIETSIPFSIEDARDASIQPTYEELKPRKAIDLASFLTCIQPTYEELKPNMISNVSAWLFLYPAYLWGIETSIPKRISERLI